MATKYRLPPLGRAYDLNTGKRVENANELINPEGGTNAELMRQWHLKQLGDIGAVWKDFTGKGVSVGVYDSGVEKAHWDLAANYDASKHVVIDGQTLDGEPVANPSDGSAAHGTSVAGLIGAARNGRGGVGVAYDAKLTGINIFDPLSPTFVNGVNRDGLVSALRQANQFDVVNHSWGGQGGYGRVDSRSNPDSFSSVLSRTFEYAAETGRDGLGTITVMAAGNNGTAGQSLSGATDRHAIAVAAYREVDGVSSNYSNHGGHLLISAPSNDYAYLGGTGLVTTDLLGSRGYNWFADPSTPNDYTDSFGGTSGATPIVSGVVALMLEANDNLGWRDVQNILAASAKMPVAFETGQVAIGAMRDGTRVEVQMNESWFKLAGDEAGWNGGRMHFSNDYGYGAVDAYNATRMAEVWGLFSAAKTSANEVHEVSRVDVGLKAIGLPGPAQTAAQFFGEISGDIVRKSFTVDSDIALERLDLSIAYENLQDYDLGFFGKGKASSDFFLSQIKLIAPDGSVSFAGAAGPVAVLPSAADNEFTFGFSGMRGVESKGQWTLEFSTKGLEDEFLGSKIKVLNELTIKSLKLDMYGSAVTNDDVYTYTNEFFTMAEIKGEGSRRTLVDTEGGTDWINAAAVSSDVRVSLVGGQATTFGGERAFTIGRTSMIENAVTGDGNDTLIGNRFDNFLIGMRGNDTLNGGAGNDWLIGGTGNDRFLFDNAGTSGKDLVLDFNRGDLIGTQTALRGAGNDGKITVAASTLLLLDGTRNGDTAQLSQQGGAVLQVAGQKDGYFWYSFVSGTDIKMGDAIREASFQPEQSGAGMVEALATMGAIHGGTTDFAVGDVALAGPVGDHGSFYLYDAMAGSMSGGVLLHA